MLKIGEIEGWVDYAQKLFNNEIQIKIISQKNFRQTYFYHCDGC
jgi:hypothetical protein